MRLAQLVSDYILFKQSLGMRFHTDATILKAFCRSMGNISIAEVESHPVAKFLEGHGAITSFWERKFTALSGLYRFARGRGYVHNSPLPLIKPKSPVPLTPHIYTTEQISALLAGTASYDSGRSNLQPDTFRHLLLLLFGAGLRIGEALRLRLSDVDFSANLLEVHESKFFKSRLVPMNQQLSKELAGYAQRRRLVPCPEGEDSAFFPSRNGTRLLVKSVERRFRKLCNAAGIRRDGGPRSQPRLHDARHSFAVGRLVSWYRAGSDVQRLLPILSTYLGHVDILATQRYLTMTSDLYQEACSRFEKYAGGGANHD